MAESVGKEVKLVDRRSQFCRPRTHRLQRIGCLLALLAIVSLLAACARGQTEIGPPEIRYGEDVCAACAMIISDPRFAAGYVVEHKPGRYESLAFDDIGDMLTHPAHTPDAKIVAWYVHDYVGEEWLDATTAHYVVSPQIASPMGHGIAAFATLDAAEALALETGSTVLTWPALEEHAAATAGSMHSH
jgi:copper chaperone NosL